jgi:hypothetical protein
MRIHSLVIDDFFKDPEETRERALDTEFKTVVSPYDKAKFPNISANVSPCLKEEFNWNLEQTFRKTVTFKECFFRITRKYTPYQYVHTDEIIDSHAALVYLNKKYPEDSGTQIMVPNKKKPSQKEPKDWEISVHCEAKFNRCFVFNAGDFHRQLPPQGFGTNNENSRLILIAWFHF